MSRFTVHIVTGGRRLPFDHPNPLHHLRLTRLARELDRSHGMAACGGCSWFLRWPVRDGGGDHIAGAAFQHLMSAHFDALLDGRACIDPDLVDGGEAHLRGRLRAVPAHLRRAFSTASAS